MQNSLILQQEISKKRRISIAIVAIACYSFFAMTLGRSAGAGSGSPVLFLNMFDIRGIITQLQMLISIYLVLRLERAGYIIALCLNGVSMLMAVFSALSTKSLSSLPGLVSYMAVIMISTYIFAYETQLALSFHQIKEQKEQLEISRKKLYQQAFYDSLTSLANRSFYMESLEKEILKAAKQESPIAVLYLDLDSFKTVNDTLGHAAGDAVLVEVSKRLSQALSDNCLISRAGGDEFFVLIRDAENVADIERAAQNIMSALKIPLVVQEMEFYLSCCIGIAIYPIDGELADELIKNADIAMYEAKRKGKNSYIFCDESLRQETLRKAVLTNSLYKALENNEFFLEYQPQVSVENEEIIGLEALLRWNHSDFGMVPPGEFIPLAEQTGLINPIGLWVFRTACEHYKKICHTTSEIFRISINFSMEQLKHPHIIPQITRIINEVNIEPRHIIIEITESMAYRLEMEILRKLIQLKEMGFSIAIDDFGTEYSSLNRICAFPLDLIKLDMGFVHIISTGHSKDRAIVKTMIQMAKNLGIPVLAEGVENKEQYEFLKSEKCDQIQGFYFYKSMPVAKAEEILVIQESRKQVLG